jgi:hypothetical protein
MGRSRGRLWRGASGDEVGVDPGVEVSEFNAQTTAKLRGAELAVRDRAIDGVGRKPSGLGDLADSEQTSSKLAHTFTWKPNLGSSPGTSLFDRPTSPYLERSIRRCIRHSIGTVSGGSPRRKAQ